MKDEKNGLKPWQNKLHSIIFEADTPGGKRFDVALLWAIVFSIAIIMLESVPNIEAKYGLILRVLGWMFTFFFTVEYVLRIISVKKPLSYIFSFFGLIDLLAILPHYLSLIFPGVHSLLVIRFIRVLRVFRVFKMGQYVGEGKLLMNALRSSRIKITVFILGVLSVVVVCGTLMYLIEGPENGFTSIPRSIYWAIVTMTTVGYGDICPKTPLGQTLASVIMIMGYGIIAVPTGIVSAELANPQWKTIRNIACPSCAKEGHDPDAEHCKYCGEGL